MKYNLQFTISQGEYWWGGAIHDGAKMPLTIKSQYHIDMNKDTMGNQAMPFFVSTKGRYIWSNMAFQIEFNQGVVTAQSDNAEILICETNGDLKKAYGTAMKEHFAFSGEIPEADFYMNPQYNTWVELLYNQNQEGVLIYAKNILANGFEPGILMIDDTWQENYGVWDFSKTKFPDPKKMCDDLHAMGFKLMLWIVPYISPDSEEFRKANEIPNTIVTDKNGDVKILRWWNGYSACIDLTTAEGINWFDAKLSCLMDNYGVDGFKFDGASVGEYTSIGVVNGIAPVERTQAYFNFAAKYRFNEVKDTWKAGGLPLNQRLRDKSHTWDGEGLSCIIPDAIALSLTGHPFQCPDMVGGGEWTCFTIGGIMDEELIVRCAQTSALFPMMQFSVAPWRILTKENCELVRDMAKLHCDMAMELFDMVKASALTGEPIIAPLCYYFPNDGYEVILDQFMVGDSILVAPVIIKGQREREVVFPQGNWTDSNGNLYIGGATVKMPAPLEKLLWFRKQS